MLMSKLFQDFQADDDWDNTVFLSHAKRNIEHFENYIEAPLLEADSPTVFSERLKKAMFNELTSFWQNQTIDQHTRDILPIWEPFNFPIQPLSKQTESWLIRCCFTQNFTLNFKTKHNKNAANTCRGCGTATETIEHILLECPIASSAREKLKKDVNMSTLDLKTILGTPEAMRATESFISSAKLAKIFT